MTAAAAGVLLASPAPALQPAAASSGRLRGAPGSAHDARRTIVAQGPGYVFRASRLRDGAYAVHEEVTSPELVEALHGRSARAVLTLDCARHSSTLTSVRVFPAPGEAGAGTDVASSAWLKAAPVDLFDLSEALCPASAASAEPPASASVAPDPPPPDSPLPASPEATGPRAAEAPQLRPAGAEASPESGHWVQLGAFASASLAEDAWAKRPALGAKLGAPRHRVEPVRREASQLYRLLAGPYATLAAARAACATARQDGLACIAR